MSNSIVLERSTPKLFTEGRDGKLNQDAQQYCLGTSTPTLFTGGGDGKIKPDAKQYCLATVNTKTVHWSRWKD